ncbi:MAG: calcium/proton exchanger [Elainella sp.]
MNRIWAELSQNWPWLALLVFVPLTFLTKQWQWDDTVVFACSALAIVPLSIWLSNATEKIAEVTGPVVGGLINAGFGSATVLILALAALRAGLIDIVEAMVTGSILTALLVLLGLAMLTGGLRYKEQTFKPIVAQVSGTTMTLAVVALSLPTTLIATTQIEDGAAIRQISVIVSGLLIVVYALNLLFSLKTHRYLYILPAEADEQPQPDKGSLVANQAKAGVNLWFWIGVLLVATVGIAAVSELFVDLVEQETQALGLTPYFTGVILLPLLSDVASCLIVVRLALKNQMNLTVATITGDSLIVMLFVAPVLVLVGQALGQPIDLNFDSFEVIAIAIAVTVANLISFSGRSNWLDGSLLLATYIVLGVAFYYHPA